VLWGVPEAAFPDGVAAARPRSTTAFEVSLHRDDEYDPPKRDEATSPRAGALCARRSRSGRPGVETVRLLVVGGSTATARIDGISAAGASADLRLHTPAADLEIVAYGRPVEAPVVPVSPDGCPTPAAVTRAARELTDVETTAVDAGLARPTAAPTVDLDATPGADVREAVAVPDAERLFERARHLGASLPDDHLVVGETIPAGTTTAMGVLAALGEPSAVASSLPENPLERKRAVVETGLAESGLERGDAAGDPLAALSAMGDPVLAAVAGFAVGALDRGATVTLGGGTQMAAAGALLRHHGVEAPLELATTPFLAEDPDSDVTGLAETLDLDLVVTDPAFDEPSHPATDAYERGVAKEGVCAGGALALAERRGVAPSDVRDRFVAVADRLLDLAPVEP